MKYDQSVRDIFLSPQPGKVSLSLAVPKGTSYVSSVSVEVQGWKKLFDRKICRRELGFNVFLKYKEDQAVKGLSIPTKLGTFYPTDLD